MGIFHKDLEGHRKRLIDMLAVYRKSKGHDITVVFDGWKSGNKTESRSITGGVTVIYSRLGEKADSVIKRIITTDKRTWIVVTSDRDIAAHAWSCGSIVLSAEEFLSVLNKPEKAVSGNFDFIEEEDYESPKKGSPKKLSKKEKAKRRALSKL